MSDYDVCAICKQAFRDFINLRDERTGELATDDTEERHTVMMCGNCAEGVRDAVGRVAPDGGVIAPDADDEPSPRRAIRIVLEDAQPGGLDRGVLVERAAEIARATRADVEQALNGKIAEGECYRLDEEVKLTPSRQMERDWGGRA